jgi:hypothetical protein
MLAHRANGAFVCLRCELHALRPRPRPRLPPSTALAALAAYTRFYASSPRPRDALDGLEPQASDSAQDPNAEPTIKTAPDRPQRKRAVRGRAVLGNMTSLGTEANILVLGEVERRKPKEVDRPPPKAAAPIDIEAPSLLASLQQDSSPLSPEEITKQIDSLRPSESNSRTEPHRLTRRAFVKVTRALCKGFTAKQLSSYYAAAKNLTQKRLRRHLANAVKPKQPDSCGPVARTPWQPTSGRSNTRMDIRLPGLDVLHQTNRAPLTKDAVADGILRHIWRVELLEEVEGVGQLELSLRPWQLQLLLNTGRDKATLDAVARTRKAKIQVHRAHNVVRITADKNAAEYAANDIEDALRNAESVMIPFKGWNAQLDDPRVDPIVKNEKRSGTTDVARVFAQNDLDHVSELTRTNISLANGNSGLQIRGFDLASINEAQQYLLRLLPVKNHVKRTYDTKKIDADVGDCYLVPAVHEPKSLDYSYRDVALGRWSLPIPRVRKTSAGSDGHEAVKPETTQANVEEPEEPKEPKHIFDSRVHRVVSKIHRRPDPHRSTLERIGSWAETEFRISAEFGQALFPLASPDPKSIAVTLDTPGRELPFQPMLPGLANFLATSNIELKKRTETPALLYEFVPAPGQKGFKRDQQFPTLHIQMRPHRDKRGCVLHKLSLGLPWKDHVHDVLLPDKATDVRFRRYERLRFDVSGHDDTNVTEWVDAVRANIASGERLTAPSLCLRIPRWTVPNHKSDEPELPDSEGMLTVNYLFTSVQVRQSAIGSLGETRFSYTTMQSDSMGASGGGVNVYPLDNSSGSSSEDKDDINAFVRNSFKIADMITRASASRRPIPKVLTPSEGRKPRDMQSERKLRRAALQQNLEQDAEDDIVTASDEGVAEANSAMEQEYELEPTLHQVTTEVDDGDLAQPSEPLQALDGQASSVSDELIESAESPGTADTVTTDAEHTDAEHTDAEPTDAEPTDAEPIDTTPSSEDVQNQPKP